MFYDSQVSCRHKFSWIWPSKRESLEDCNSPMYRWLWRIYIAFLGIEKLLETNSKRNHLWSVMPSKHVTSIVNTHFTLEFLARSFHTLIIDELNFREDIPVSALIHYYPTPFISYRTSLELNFREDIPVSALIHYYPTPFISYRTSDISYHRTTSITS